MKLNDARYIFFYCILNCNDNCTFYLYGSYMSFINILLKHFKSVICCHFCHIFFEAVKELHKVPSSIFIYISIRKFTITVASNQQTPNSLAISGFSRSWWAISQCSFKPPDSGKLRQSTTVSILCERLY